MSGGMLKDTLDEAGVDAVKGSKAFSRVSNVLHSPSPEPSCSIPPLLEARGLFELNHNPNNNRIRAN